jgi:hypothetical protein
MRSHTTLVAVAALLTLPVFAQDRKVTEAAAKATKGGAVFAAPVRLEADGKPIDIGKLSRYAHAGPWVADIDGDGDRDVLVGDFPGYFWLFDNTGTDKQPVYTAKGRFMAGRHAAKTPVY